MENGQFLLIFFVRVLSLLMIACQSSPNLLDWSDWSFQMSDFRSGSHQKKHVIFTHFKTTGMTAKIWRCRNTVFFWQCYYNNIPVHTSSTMWGEEDVRIPNGDSNTWPSSLYNSFFAKYDRITTAVAIRCTLIPLTFSLCQWKSWRTDICWPMSTPRVANVWYSSIWYGFFVE